MISIKSKSEIEKMAVSGKLLSDTFKVLKKYIKPGVTTLELDKIAEDTIRSFGAVPSFLNYNGFSASICASKNSEVVHGIPNNEKLADGDIISLDIGLVKNGYHADSAKTYPVGKISKDAQQLIDVTRQCFYKGIEYAKHGNRLHDISAAIQQYAESFGYGVVRDLVGHGIGTHLHEDPNVPNFGKANTGMKLVKGMTIAIEPMINMGTKNVMVLPNDWTVVSKDGSLSSHYEHTIVITDGQPIILTL